MAFDNCDVEITNNSTSRSAISTSDHTIASGASLYTRINGSSLIVKDSDFRIYSDASAINIGNGYPYGLQDMATADVVFDNSRAEILLGLTDKYATKTGISKTSATAVLDVKNGSSLAISSNKTGGWTAFNTVHVDKTSEMLIDFKSPYNEDLKGGALNGISVRSIDIEGRLNISMENGYEDLSNVQTCINCNEKVNFHNGADVDIYAKGGKTLYGIDCAVTNSEINVNNADLDILLLSDPTSTSRSYGIYSITDTLSNANVKIDVQGGYFTCYYTVGLVIDNTNLEIGLHRGLDKITMYNAFDLIDMVGTSATLTGNNTIITRVPKECYASIKSRMDRYLPAGSYDIDKCICEPGKISSECMKKAEEITPFVGISAPQRDAESISFIAAWHRGDAETGKPIAVLYDEVGRMVSLQFLSDIEANDRTNVTFPLDGMTGPCSVKLFLWEDFLKICPLCGFEEVSFPALTE